MTSIETIRAIYHPTRQRIIEYLGTHGPSQVSTLARELSEQVGSISHHLRMLERVGVAERVPELATDGRTSWWRVPPDHSISWSVDDFSDSPAEQMQARAAEKLGIERQMAKLTAWKRSSAGEAEQWRRAAFTTTTSAVATSEELARLSDMLSATLAEWRGSIDREDGQERRPVFFFSHGFPTRP